MKGTCQEVMQYISIFGPVVDSHFDAYIGKDDRFAIQWTGFAVEEHTDPSGGFIRLAHAHDVNAGMDAVKNMSLPGVNIVLADKAGNIGYAYAGLVPNRDAKQNPYLPFNGQFSSSRWAGFSENLKPSLINPVSGYIVTANQNIYGQDADAQFDFGKVGAAPYRALRINERIKDMIGKSSVLDFDELSAVQLDSTSIEAKELAPAVGAICVEHFHNADGYRQSFARAVSKFDGNYTTESIEALPYEMLMDEIVAQRIKVAFDTTDAKLLGNAYLLRYPIKDALRKELSGIKTAIFSGSSPNGLVGAVNAACEPAYQKLVTRASKNQWAWRWGRHHYLKRRNPIANAPFVGGFFRDKKREVAGVASAPLAESGLPVKYGANLRFRVKMSDPPEIYAVLDGGNSGTPSSKNAYDQAELWHAGKDLRMVTDWAAALKNTIAYFELDRTAQRARN